MAAAAPAAAADAKTGGTTGGSASVTHFTGPGGKKGVRLRVASVDGAEWATADVYLFGAHVTHWADSKCGPEPLLFVSSKAVLNGSRAIRGGIPVIFPQFSGFGALPTHGFARTADWSVRDARLHLTGLNPADQTEAVQRADAVTVVLGLTHTPETAKVWPAGGHAFDAEYHVTLTGVADGCSQLKCQLRVANLNKPQPQASGTGAGEGAFTFTAALHTYFRVGDIAHASVNDLRGVTYIDQLSKAADKTVATPNSAAHADVRFGAETDRIYLSAPERLCVCDAKLSRVIVVRKSAGFPDAVVWNPWVDKAKGFPDFAADEYRQMLCVEAAVIATPAAVQPGSAWSGHIVMSHCPAAPPKQPLLTAH